MEKFGKSQPVRRVEDVRFLTGGGRYVDDIAPPDALHAIFFRSPVAHGRIKSLDLDEAREAPGVAAILTAADLEAAGVELGVPGEVIRNRDGTRAAAPTRPILAGDRVRFVGEPVALVVAETKTAARDAADLIFFDFEELDPHVDPVPGGPAIHDEAPENVAFDYGRGDEAATEAAFAKAARVVTLQIADNRVIANPMEPRGCYAEWDGERLHLCFNGQGVWSGKDDVVRHLRLPEDKVRVTNPDVGGGFGMKAMTYPEYLAVAAAARALGRPVRWMSERTEAMLSDNGGRDLVSTTELAFDADHRILGYRVRTTCNLGAYNSFNGQIIQTDLFAKVLSGVYDIKAAWLQATGVYTNTVQVDAYRGAGRPEAIYALERSIDNAARELGLDPFELRRLNFIRPDSFPYRTPTGETYDVGDFERVLTRAEEACDRAGFAARRDESRARGRLRGIGLSFYIEAILGDPSEDVKVEFRDDGTAAIYVGTQSNGQGHETVFRQFLADQTGIPADKIVVVQGDSDLIAHGGGTGGSRSVTVQTNATLAAVEVMVRRFGEFLAGEMAVDPEAVGFDDERFRAEGSNLTPTMLEAAEMARAAGREDLLLFQERAKLPGRSYPNGAHIAEVEIDPDTGAVAVARYTVTDDFGNLINPLLVEGQVHGGVAQGIGQAVQERVVYDESGQLLTATFMDYGMPRAIDMPLVAFHTAPVPSKNNPLGMKGCGEAGTVGALAAVANAVLDAVWETGVRKVDMPFTPHRMWQMMQQAPVAAE